MSTTNGKSSLNNLYIIFYYLMFYIVTHSLFKYDPSVAAASIFLILFLITTVWHLYQIIRSKSFYLLAIVVCGTCKHNSIKKDHRFICVFQVK